MSRDAPVLFRVVLPPSHPFCRLSREQWERLWGPRVELIVSKPIPEK